MMRILGAVLLLTLPADAASQTTTMSTQTTIGGYRYQVPTTSWTLGALPPNSSARDQGDRQCLRHKRGGKVECHTYAEWAAIARAIELGHKY